MDVGLILKIAGVGMLVSVSCQVLGRIGRDEQSMLVSLAGLVLVLLMLTEEIGRLFETVRRVFGV